MTCDGKTALNLLCIGNLCMTCDGKLEMVKRIGINSARVGVNRDMIMWKEPRSSRIRRHRLREAPHQ